MDTIANTTVSVGSTDTWTDHKRYLWLIGLVVPSLAFTGYGLWLATGIGAWFWIGPVVILVIVPAIDLFAGLDRSNPPDDALEALEKDTYYRWITYAFLPIQYAGFLGAMYLIVRGDPLGIGGDLRIVDKLGLAISIGCIGGIGINTAHELGHKREANERWLSKIALAQSCYGHFYIEHNRGHHVRVATPEDPASSRLGESFYQFWPRTVLGSMASAWRIEKRRYARNKRHPFRIGNDVLNAWLMSVVLFGAVTAWLGVEVVPYLVIQAIVGLSLLEVVNYMEHYGMLRQKVGKPGKERYERVDPSHSWNSNNIATNVLLYHLQRHSDHHANPTRRYQSLRDYQESPVLPTGYAGMMVLAIVPAIWRRVMDPRVVAHFDGDLTRANISPRKREKYLEAQRRSEAIAATADPAETHRGSEAVADTATRHRADPAETHRGSEAEEGGLRRVGDTPVAGAAERRPGAARVGLNTESTSTTTGATDEVLAARCPGCGYTYEVEVGNELEGFAAGTAWSDVPDDWCCPDCGVREKVDFVPVDNVDATG